MTAWITLATMSDGTPFPFPMFNLTTEDGREFHDLTPPQVMSLAAREGWQIKRTQ